jgi:hypothetical protein
MPHPCSYCFATLTNGSAFCDDDCEDGQWAIVPTIDGEIYQPEPEETSLDPAEPGIPPTRPTLELPPQPDEAAGFMNRRYIDATRLRQNLLAARL